MILLGLNNFDKLIDNYIMVSATDLEGYITFASNRFCKMSGYTKEELIGKNHNILRHPDMSQKIFREMWETIKEDKVWNGLIKNLTKDGKYYLSDATVSSVFDQYTGKKIGYKSIRLDVTGYKELDQLNYSIEKVFKNETISKDEIYEYLKNKMESDYLEYKSPENLL